MFENKPCRYILESGDLLILFLNSAFYITIGLISFNLRDKIARSKGLFGAY